MAVAWVFPGQGSQVVGMGRDLYKHLPAARDVFEQADAILDMALSRLCFEGPEEALLATENAQPAILTTCVALLHVLHHYVPAGRAIRPAAVAGHSLGEYAALVAGDSLDIATATRLVRRRGELMAAASEGTMAAVIGLSADALDSVCADASEQTGQAVVIANYNAPGQLVMSGATAAVELAGKLARQQGARKVMPLKVSAAFHSPLMSEAACQMRQVLAAAPIADPSIPLIANVHAAPLMNAAEVRAELAAQIESPVRWTDSIEWMLARGITTVIEIGPGKVLSGLIKRIAPQVQLINLRNVDDLQALTTHIPGLLDTTPEGSASRPAPNALQWGT